MPIGDLPNMKNLRQIPTNGACQFSATHTEETPRKLKEAIGNYLETNYFKYPEPGAEKSKSLKASILSKEQNNK